MLNITIGISGSGKSTYIKNNKKSNDIVINPDSIRKELTGDISNQSKNKEVWETAYSRLSNSIGDIWFDATSLKMSSINSLLKEYNGKDVTIFIKKDSNNLKLCQERVNKDISNKVDRSNVPMEIIEKQQKQFNTLIPILKSGIKDIEKKYNKNIEIKEV